MNQPPGVLTGLPPSSSALRSRLRGLSACALAACALAGALGLGFAASAGAEVIHESSLPSVGLQPRDASTLRDGNTLEALSFANSAKNPVLHTPPVVYAVYWEPLNNLYHPDWQELINGFLSNLASTSGNTPAATVLGVDSQYSDGTGAPAATSIVYGGAYIDTNPYPSSGCFDPAPLDFSGVILGAEACITDAQLRAQLEAFIHERGLPVGMSHLYVMLTAPGVTVCLDAGGNSGHCSDFYRGSEAEVKQQTRGKQNLISQIESEEAKSSGELSTTEREQLESYKHSFCSYHSYFDIASAPVLYAVVPWTAGGAGNTRFPESERTQADECQMGEFNATSKAPLVEERETVGYDQEPNQSGMGPNGSFEHGLADLIITQIGSELQNTITDPLLNAWQGANGGELTDQCRNFFAPATGSYGASEATEAGTIGNQALEGREYALNDAFDLAALKIAYPGVPCVTGVAGTASFSAPATAKVGEAVAFDGGQSWTAIGWSGYKLGETGAFAKFKWEFGDGTPAVEGYAPPAPACKVPLSPSCAVVVSHTYATPGKYVVRLTLEDPPINGEESGVSFSTTEVIHVIGPPPAPAESPSGSATTGASGGVGSTGTTGTTGSTASSSLPVPSAHASAVSGSLRAAVRHGLVVRYQVNEQVAGVIEVLLNANLAHRLHIRGPLAAGLPTGSLRQVVIGRALIVTRRGGAGRVRVHLNRSAVRALRRLKRVLLTLHITLRNAERSHPKTAALTTRTLLKRGGAPGKRIRAFRKR